jgi:hypothetical protein
MKTKKPKQKKSFDLSAVKPVGPLQRNSPRESALDNIHMPFAIVFPDAREGQQVAPMCFGRPELEAITNFVASEHVLPGQMKPLLPIAQAILRGWLNSRF